MTSNTNSVGAPYLPTSKSFTGTLEQVQLELGKTYIEIAQVVNRRTIGIFNTFQIVTGNQWFTNGVPGANSSSGTRQSYRKAFVFGAIAQGADVEILHGISGLTQTVALYGNCIATPASTPNAIYRPIPFLDPSTVTNGIGIWMDNDTLYITNGSTGDAIISGTAIVEYLLN